MEIDIVKINASDVAVPCCPVIELHGLLIGDSSKLSRTWKSLRDVCSQMLATDRNIKVVQDMEGLHDSFKAGVPNWRSCLEKRCSLES